MLKWHITHGHKNFLLADKTNSTSKRRIDEKTSKYAKKVVSCVMEAASFNGDGLVGNLQLRSYRSSFLQDGGENLGRL